MRRRGAISMSRETHRYEYIFRGQRRVRYSLLHGGKKCINIYNVLDCDGCEDAGS